LSSSCLSVLEFRSAQPFLDLNGLLSQRQVHQEPDELIHPVTCGYTELQQLLDDFNRGNHHPEMNKLSRSQEVSALQKLMVLRGVLFLVTELGLLDGFLEPLFCEEPFDLASQRFACPFGCGYGLARTLCGHDARRSRRR
jgi:hypothetical protein